MPFTPAEIVNQALGQLGSEMSVVDFWTDDSLQAMAARTYYGLCLRLMLADFPWPFATVMAPLVVADWYFSRERRFAYLYPPNCMSVRRLYQPWGNQRNPDVQHRPKSKIIQTPNPQNTTQLVKVILADLDCLQVEYTTDMMKSGSFPDRFSDALAYFLAWKMAPSLTGGDPYKLGVMAQQNFVQALRTAEAEAGNEQIDDEPPLGEFIDERQGRWHDQDRQGEQWAALPSGTPIE